MARSDEASERESDYRATADSIADSAERVADLEVEKSKLSPSDPKARRLTAEVESELGKMDQENSVQRSLVDQAAQDGPTRRQH